uniref:FimD/PapC N-terminal domain-containing protein n=1 Tax=Escherichia coli TaxID=562 RepID=UPI0013CF93CC
AVLIYLILTGASSISSSALANSDIEFDADILDLKDKQNIDLSDFSRAGYIMPGRYEFVVRVNNNELPELYNISYVVPA